MWSYNENIKLPIRIPVNQPFVKEELQEGEQYSRALCLECKYLTDTYFECDTPACTFYSLCDYCRKHTVRTTDEHADDCSNYHKIQFCKAKIDRYNKIIESLHTECKCVPITYEDRLLLHLGNPILK